MKKYKVKKLPPENPFMDFLWAAFEDYLAARVLLRSKLLTQGSVLASTAIEKYCKAILAFNGNQSKGHLKKAHWNCLKNFDPALYSIVNPSFFEFLQKVYSLRYPDDLKLGFNIVIRQRELLAELDAFVIPLERKLIISSDSTNINSKKRMIDGLIANSDDRLIGDNHALSGQERKIFITAEEDFVLELRRLSIDKLLHAFYSIAPTSSDGNFMREGFRPQPDGRSFDLNYTVGKMLRLDATCEKCGRKWIERVSLIDKKLTLLDSSPVEKCTLFSDPITHIPIKLLFSACINCN